MTEKPQPKRIRRLQVDLSVFVQKYGRKRYAGQDPNDRSYDREMEKRISKMTPEQLAELMEDEV